MEGQSCSKSSEGSEAEAQGNAAKGWLMLYGGQWKEVLAVHGVASAAFAKGSNTKPEQKAAEPVDCEIKRVIDAVDDFHEKVQSVLYTVGEAQDFYHGEHLPDMNHEYYDPEDPKMWEDPETEADGEFRDEMQMLDNELEKIHGEIKGLQKPECKLNAEAKMVVLKDKEDAIKRIESEFNELKAKYDFEERYS
jgi:hypothetical protein